MRNLFSFVLALVFGFGGYAAAEMGGEGYMETVTVYPSLVSLGSLLRGQNQVVGAISISNMIDRPIAVDSLKVGASANGMPWNNIVEASLVSIDMKTGHAEVVAIGEVADGEMTFRNFVISGERPWVDWRAYAIRALIGPGGEYGDAVDFTLESIQGFDLIVGVEVGFLNYYPKISRKFLRQTLIAPKVTAEIVSQPFYTSQSGVNIRVSIEDDYNAMRVYADFVNMDTGKIYFAAANDVYVNYEKGSEGKVSWLYLQISEDLPVGRYTAVVKTLDNGEFYSAVTQEFEIKAPLKITGQSAYEVGAGQTLILYGHSFNLGDMGVEVSTLDWDQVWSGSLTPNIWDMRGELIEQASFALPYEIYPAKKLAYQVSKPVNYGMNPPPPLTPGQYRVRIYGVGGSDETYINVIPGSLRGDQVSGTFSKGELVDVSFSSKGFDYVQLQVKYVTKADDPRGYATIDYGGYSSGSWNISLDTSFLPGPGLYQVYLVGKNGANICAEIELGAFTLTVPVLKAPADASSPESNGESDGLLAIKLYDSREEGEIIKASNRWKLLKTESRRGKVRYTVLDQSYKK